VSKVAGSNPSGGSELTFCSELLLTERGSRSERPLWLPVCCVALAIHSALGA
jgi:hypothetical protein